MKSVTRFYGLHEQYAEFSNCYNAPFTDAAGYRWETTEHFYQAHKFDHVPSFFHLLRFADHPRKAYLMGRLDPSNERLGAEPVHEGAKYSVNAEIMRHAHHRMREDWSMVKLAVMYEALTYKFTQNQSLKRLLTNTGSAHIEHDDPFDAYWGVGADGKGNNWLGHLLMTLRDELQRCD